MDFNYIGIRPKEKTYFSYLVALTFLIVSVFSVNPNALTSHIKSLPIQKDLNLIQSKLYLEFCLSRVVERENCLFSKPFFKLRRDNFVFEKSRTKNIEVLLEGMGEKFSATKHYEQFFQKLHRADKSVKELPSYERFNELLDQKKFKLHSLTDSSTFLTKQHQSLIRLLSSLFSVEGTFSIIFVVLSTLFLGIFMEVKFGKLYFPFIVLIPSFFILKYYVETLSSDSTSIILGGGILLSYLSGIFTTSMWGYKFQINSHKISYGLCSIVIYILGSLLFYLSFSSVIPGRAHFLGFTLGLFLGHFSKFLGVYKKGFFSINEYRSWKSIDREHDIFESLNKLKPLLHNNPSSLFLNNYYLSKIHIGLEQGVNQKAFYGHFRFVLPFIGEGSRLVLVNSVNKMNIELDFLPILRFLPIKMIKEMSEDHSLKKQWRILFKMLFLALVQETSEKNNISSELYQLPKDDLESFSELVMYFKHANIDEFSKNVFINLERKLKAS